MMAARDFVEPSRLVWRGGARQPVCNTAAAIFDAVQRFREPAHVLVDERSGQIGVALSGALALQSTCVALGDAHAVMASLGPLYPEWLGDRFFVENHRIRFPYVVGEMAHGIASVELVVASARAGLLAFFGAAGSPLRTVEASVARIEQALGAASFGWGVNIIHQPNDARAEQALVDLLLARRVRRASASAFLELAEPLVQFALSGLTARADGRIERRNHLFAKVSRSEVATTFLEPAPEAIVERLLTAGKITPQEAALGRRVPLCEELTVEADSAGHTDNRPLTVVFPEIKALADRLARHYRYDRTFRIGAAGGIGTATAAAAAFAMGAAYVVTGSINQTARESGMSSVARDMLAACSATDVAMAPSADMFEQGVRVQVMRRGTLFPQRAAFLYELYRSHATLEALPPDKRAALEADVFRMKLEEVWQQTRRHVGARDAALVQRADVDGRIRMALVFRWYLGQSSRWAVEGAADRRSDYQLWAGPSLGDFNRWVAGTFMQQAAHRSVTEIAYNILEGAAALTRAQQLRSHGVPVPVDAFQFLPRPLAVTLQA
jgi:PfaD family protein